MIKDYKLKKLIEIIIGQQKRILHLEKDLAATQQILIDFIHEVRHEKEIIK